MSTYKSVFDVMKNASKGRFMREGSGQEEVAEGIEFYDGEKGEYDCISLFERNVLAGLKMPDNFTIPGGKKVIELDCGTVSTANTVGGLANLMHSKKHVIDPFDVTDWVLLPESGRVAYSVHTGGSLVDDRAISGIIHSMCPNMGDAEVDSLPIGLITEKLCQGSDMVHMFCKAYLMLGDLNLAAMFQISERDFSRTMMNVVHSRVSNRTRLGLIAHKDIVVDSEGLTGEEVDVLTLMAQKYPSVRYGGHNIYTACQMDEDSVAIVSSADVERSGRIVYSPVEFYRCVVSLATKLGVIGDMHTAFSQMRGRTMQMRDVMRRVDQRAVYSGMGLSRCMSRALGGSTRFDTVVGTYPTYMATSVAIIADVLVGKGFEVTASMLVESLGGIGKLICHDRPDLSRTYQGLLRDYGLSSMHYEVNAMMLSWTDLCTVPYHWQLSRGWKDYITQLSISMWNGGDVQIPQLIYDIPMMSHQNSAWGVVRSWNGVDGAGISSMVDIGGAAKRDKDERLRKAAAFTWAMGVRPTRPKMFFNAYSAKEVSVSSGEYKWLQGACGGHRVSHVSYTINELGGREDFLEETATNIIRTTIDGTKCTVVFSAQGTWDMVEYREEEVLGIVETVSGKKEKEDVEIVQVREKEEAEAKTDVSTMFQTMRGIFTNNRVKLGGHTITKAKMVSGVRVPGAKLVDAIALDMRNAGIMHDGDLRRVADRFDGSAELDFDEEEAGKILDDSEISLVVYEDKDSGYVRKKYGNNEMVVEVHKDKMGYGVHKEDANGLPIKEEVEVDSGGLMVRPVRRAMWFRYFM
jgi:hypothetical protein